MSMSRTDLSGTTTRTPRRLFIRLTRSESNQHLALALTFILLALTGFLIYLPENVLEGVGAREALFSARRWTHRLAGAAMILTSLYHIGYVVFVPAGRSFLDDMWPRRKDLTDLVDNLAYYLGRRQHPPRFARFSYKAKAEYFALVVGNILMSTSGVVLWTEAWWSKFVLDIAQVVHSMEAVLACLALMVWHFYEVHLRPDTYPPESSWLAPVVDEETMQEEYGEHYDRIMADPELRKIYIVGEGEDSAGGDGP